MLLRQVSIIEGSGVLDQYYKLVQIQHRRRLEIGLKLFYFFRILSFFNKSELLNYLFIRCEKLKNLDQQEPGLLEDIVDFWSVTVVWV